MSINQTVHLHGAPSNSSHPLFKAGFNLQFLNVFIFPVKKLFHTVGADERKLYGLKHKVHNDYG